MKTNLLTGLTKPLSLPANKTTNKGMVLRTVCGWGWGVGGERVQVRNTATLRNLRGAYENAAALRNLKAVHILLRRRETRPGNVPLIYRLGGGWGGE